METPRSTHPIGVPNQREGDAYLLSLLGLVGKLTGASRSALLRERNGATTVWVAIAEDGASIEPSQITLPDRVRKELRSAAGGKSLSGAEGFLLHPIPGQVEGGGRLGVYLEKDSDEFSPRDREVASLFARPIAVAATGGPKQATEKPFQPLPDALLEEILLSRTTDTPLSLLMICVQNIADLDQGEGLEAVQDSLVELMLKGMRTFDRLEDWGSGEFIVTIPHTEPSEAYEIAFKLHDRLQTRRGPLPPFVRICILGVPEHAQTPEDLRLKMVALWDVLHLRDGPEIFTGDEELEDDDMPTEVGIFTGNLGTDSRNVQMLLETIFAVTSAIELETMYDRVLDMMIEMTGAERGVILLLGEDDELERVAGRAAGKIHVGREVVLSESTIERVLESGEAVFVPDVLTEKDKHLISDSIQQLKLRFILCAPLAVKGKTIGIAYLDSQIENQTFYQTNLTFFEAIAKQVAIAIENARLLGEMRAKDEERRIALERENVRLRKRLESSQTIIGECPPMKRVFDAIRKTAHTDVTVLIYGESGTGKEAIASSIHEISGRQAGPFQIVDCGAIPENLLESELFGHKKGSFTGAYETRKGKFEMAHGGTIFLDEISELPLGLQVKLLRVLQEKDIEPVGGSERRKVDVRIIAATNRRLEELVEQGLFRQDLYYRLNVITVELPALRDRGDDKLLLANYFLGRYAKEHAKEVLGFSKAASRAIQEYSWPGNVREMEHKIQRAVIMSEEKYLVPKDLDFKEEARKGQTLRDVREDAERQFVHEVLDRTGGNISLAAKEMGVSRQTLYDLLKKYKIKSVSEN